MKEIIGAFIGLVGLAILIFHGGWWIGLGVFLMLWGNNNAMRSGL